MKKYNTGLVLLLAICIVAVALGYVGSRNISNATNTVINMDATSTGIIIPQYLITSEVKDILLKISTEYPDSVIFADNEVTLVGSEAVDMFNKSVSEKNINFDMNAVSSFYTLDISDVSNGPNVVTGPYVVTYFPVTQEVNSVTISYSELEKLLDGDNETVSYYRELLNNSQHDVLPGENISLSEAEYVYSSYDNDTGMFVVSITSSGE